MVRMELDWPAQSPDINTIKHLWDELQCKLHPRTPRLTSVSDLTSTHVAERTQIPTTTSREKPSTKSGAYYKSKSGLIQYEMFKKAYMVTVVRCAQTFDHVGSVYIKSMDQRFIKIFLLPCSSTGICSLEFSSAFCRAFSISSGDHWTWSLQQSSRKWT